MVTPEKDNPFQSPAASSHVVEQPQANDDLAIAIIKAAISWSLICGISSIPSWLLASRRSTEAIAGMLTGILVFVVGYTILDVSTRRHPVRRRRDVIITLAITYGTRIAISLIIPLGFFADIWCGIIAIELTNVSLKTIGLDPINMEFTPTLVTTLIQGCLLNLVLAGYGLIVYAFCRAMVNSRSDDSRPGPI